MKDVSGHQGDGKEKQRRLQKMREDFVEQILADPERELGYVAVAWALATFLNVTTLNAYPGYGAIAKKAHVDRSTAIRAVQWMERRGHLSVTRVWNADTNKNSSNRYVPLLNRSATVTETFPKHAPNATTLVAPLCHHPSGTATSPEPLSLTSDLTSILTSSVSTDGVFEGSTGKEERGDFRDSKGPSSIESPNLGVTPKGEAFVLAIRHFQKRGGELVGLTLNKGALAPMVLDEVRAVIENGGTVEELAHALWSLTAGLSKKA
jgi:hypothetical protein